jgi:hypothetical protein
MRERKKYMKEYNKRYYELRGAPNSKIEGRYISQVNKPVQPTEYNFSGNEIDEPIVCRHFGCGKRLSLPEQLAGTKCTNHMKENKIEPSDFIVHFKRAI